MEDKMVQKKCHMGMRWHLYETELSNFYGRKKTSLDSFFTCLEKNYTVLCPIKVNSNTIELNKLTSCYCILDLLCVKTVPPCPVHNTGLNQSCFKIKFFCHFSPFIFSCSFKCYHILFMLKIKKSYFAHYYKGGSRHNCKIKNQHSI